MPVNPTLFGAGGGTAGAFQVPALAAAAEEPMQVDVEGGGGGGGIVEQNSNNGEGNGALQQQAGRNNSKAFIVENPPLDLEAYVQGIKSIVFFLQMLETSSSA